jgi:hypothetical protein
LPLTCGTREPTIAPSAARCRQVQRPVPQIVIRDHRHPKSARVLCLDDGSALTQDVVGEYVRKAGCGDVRLCTYGASARQPSRLSARRKKWPARRAGLAEARAQRERRLAGWTGLEPGSPRRVNQLTACELWLQRVDGQLINATKCGPLTSS